MHGAVQLQMLTARVARQGDDNSWLFCSTRELGGPVHSRAERWPRDLAGCCPATPYVVVRKPSTVVCTFMMTHVWDIIRARFTCSAKLAHVRGSILDWAHCAVTT